jgi:hypothetical protein
MPVRIIPEPSRVEVMMRTYILSIGVLGLVVSAVPSGAQQADALQETAVLARIEMRDDVWGRVELVQLPARVRVGALGLIGADLAPLTASGDASAHGRSAARNRRAGTALLALGALISTGALTSYAIGDGGMGMSSGEIAFLGGGVSAILLGGQRVSVSNRQLQRAADAYNRDAVRLAAQPPAD